jgi:hypothetical protein
MDFTYSKHAEERMNQRDIKKADIEILLDHADIIIPARNGCRDYSMSFHAAQELIEFGVPARSVERLKVLGAIISHDGCVVTAKKNYRVRNRAKAKTWRRSRAAHKALRQLKWAM